MSKLKLHWQILIALLLACLAGQLSGINGSFLGIRFYDIYNFIGTLFLNALKMIIVPLIVSSMITGISTISDNRSLGRLGTKTISYYLLTSFLAIMAGLLIVNIINPGVIDGMAAGKQLGLSPLSASTTDKISHHSTQDIAFVFLRMVPPNVVAAAVKGELLGLIFFSFIFGYFMMRITKSYSQTLQSLWQGIFETMMKITLWVMKFAPYGVFGLVAKTIAITGFSAFRPMLAFFITVILALSFHFFITLGLLLHCIGGVKPWRQYKAMLPAILMAFSSSSSAATLPLTIECVEENCKVSNKISSFVLPLGATINMDGTALYECVAAIFIAQAYGLHLGFTTQFLIVIIALLTSIGVAGIPAASLVAISIILGAIGLPIEAIGIILVTDRFLDMCRTSVNVFSDSCGASIIARSEKETQVLADDKI